MTGISELTKYLQCTKTFDKVMSKLKLLKLGGGCALAELKVEEEHTNSLGGLHGGFSATLVDMVSTYALSTHRNGDYPTVSVDMFMSYCKGVKIGNDILIKANTLKAGKSLAFLEVLITNKASGNVLVKGSHTKYIMRK